MAENTRIEIVDDLDKSMPGERRAVLGLNNRVVSLDLSNQNYERLVAAIEEFLAAGQVLVGLDLIREDIKRRIDPVRIRTWATIKGMEIRPRGRIPEEIERKFIAEEVTQYGP